MTLFAKRPSPAFVVAVLALLVAVGGTSYAAFNLPKNSVGTKQIKNNAVTTSKIKNGAVTGSKVNLSTLGTVHSADAANSAAFANNANNAANAASLGGTPASAYVQFGSTLPSGSTETGIWATGGGDSASGIEATGFRFNPPLPAALNEQHTIFTTSTTTHCSGLGQADPGYLCVYVSSSALHNVTFSSIGNGAGRAGASPSGAALLFTITAAGSDAQGFWSVTAP